MTRLHIFRVRLWRAWHVFRGRPLIYGITIRTLPGDPTWVRVGAPLNHLMIDGLTVDGSGTHIELTDIGTGA